MSMHFKQEKLYNPEKDGQPRIYVYGCGSIGSHVIMGLAKTGFKNITVYDYDKVEEDNLPAQMYRFSDVGKNKVHAIQSFVSSMSNCEINVHHVKVTEEIGLSKSMNSVHVICFDNIDSRKVVYNQLKGFPVWIIDGRIGGFRYDKFLLNAGSKDNSYYEQSLEGEFVELPCGEKCLWSVNALLGAEIVADVIKLSKIYEDTGNGYVYGKYSIRGSLMGVHRVFKEVELDEA